MLFSIRSLQTDGNSSDIADGGKIKVGDIFIGAAPFDLTMLVVLVLIVFFPQITLVLVR